MPPLCPGGKRWNDEKARPWVSLMRKVFVLCVQSLHNRRTFLPFILRVHTFFYSTVSFYVHSSGNSKSWENKRSWERSNGFICRLSQNLLVLHPEARAVWGKILEPFRKSQRHAVHFPRLAVDRLTDTRWERGRGEFGTQTTSNVTIC